jgi:8-oxo-dGTP pyrophosphatase MutT (NUDIX family)
MKSSVSILVTDGMGKVVVSLRTAACKSFVDFWQFPGGTVEPNENVQVAAQRELKEETGLFVPLDRLRILGRDYREHYVGYAFKLELLPRECLVNAEPDKCVRFGLKPISVVKRLNMIPGLKQYLKHL